MLPAYFLSVKKAGGTPPSEDRHLPGSQRVGPGLPATGSMKTGVNRRFSGCFLDLECCQMKYL